MLNMKIHGDALNLGPLQCVPGIGEKSRVSLVRRTWRKFTSVFFPRLVGKGRGISKSSGTSTCYTMAGIAIFGILIMSLCSSIPLRI